MLRGKLDVQAAATGQAAPLRNDDVNVFLQSEKKDPLEKVPGLIEQLKSMPFPFAGKALDEILLILDKAEGKVKKKSDNEESHNALLAGLFRMDYINTLRSLAVLAYGDSFISHTSMLENGDNFDLEQIANSPDELRRAVRTMGYCSPADEASKKKVQEKIVDAYVAWADCLVNIYNKGNSAEILIWESGTEAHKAATTAYEKAHELARLYCCTIKKRNEIRRKWNAILPPRERREYEY